MDVIPSIIANLSEAATQIEMGLVTPVIVIFGVAAGALWVARRKKTDGA